MRNFFVTCMCCLCSLTAFAADSATEVQFLRGGDLSMVTYLEDWGTKFKYKDGTEGDVFDILEEYGVNFARLRIYNHPGTAVKHDGNTYRTPVKSPYNNWAGHPDYYAGPDDILSLAKRAKAHNMNICLSFHLSDYWTNATTQMIPSAWQEVTSNEVLGDSVYNFVKSVMERMKAQGTTPEYVSIGNESNYGILFNTLDGTRVDFGGHTDNIAQCAALFNRAYDAVKAVAPAAQVVIHHSYGHDGRISACRAFFKNLQSNGCKFDVVGGSYYPYWASLQHSSDNTPTGMLAWAKDMKDNIGKPVLIMETGYSWTPYRPADKNKGEYEGQLHLNGDQYNEASEAGQEAFIKSLHEALAKDENIVGYLYWDPVFVDQKLPANYWTEVCWAEKYDESAGKWWQDGNVISNTTLFDYTGLPLSALYNEIASLKPQAPMDVESQKSNSRNQKFLRNGQLLIRSNGHIYTPLGARVE